MKNNTAYFFVFMFWVFSVNAQSKKEQIENLNYQNDSLNQVLLKEQKINTISTFEISQLNAELTRLNASISSLNAEVSKLTSSLKSNQEELSNLLKSNQEELSKLQAKLKIKSDSLLLVQKELNKLKPPPIQINNTPAVVSQQIGSYKTVQIGTQVWMAKNLDVSTFRNGDLIPEAKTDEEWKKAGENKQPAWCYFKNDSIDNKMYGKLYNCWVIRDKRILAPEGYHIPTENEWRILISYLGGSEIAGEKMKSQSGWNVYKQNAEYDKFGELIQSEMSISGNGTNISGFTGNPFGIRSYNQIGDPFYGNNECTMWWSSTVASWTKNEITFGLSNEGKFVDEGNNNIFGGLYLRCIKD